MYTVAVFVPSTEDRWDTGRGGRWVLVVVVIVGGGHSRLSLPPRSVNVSDYEVHLGELMITLSPHFSTVKQIIMYSGAPGPPGSSGDIALVQLATPVALSSQVQPVCLPEASADFHPGMQCWVTGWGYTREGGKEPLLKSPTMGIREGKGGYLGRSKSHWCHHLLLVALPIPLKDQPPIGLCQDPRLTHRLGPDKASMVGL